MKRLPSITAAEWEVMMVVWRRSPVAAAAVMAELRESKHWTLTTVRTLLRRLVEKGAIAQRRRGRRYEYAPRVSMEACMRRECGLFFDRVPSGAPAAVVLELFTRACRSRDDLQELRPLLRDRRGAAGWHAEP